MEHSTTDNRQPTSSTVLENNELYRPLILVVDNNLQFLESITLTLEVEGFKVLTAENGQDALERLRDIPIGQSEAAPEEKRLPDLILSNVTMPVMDGYEFYERVRTHPYTNHIPFIFLNIKASAKDIWYGKELGAEDYISTLTPINDLLATIRGKIKRVEQQRDIMARFDEDMGQSGKGGGFILLVIMALLLMLAFYLGMLFS